MYLNKAIVYGNLTRDPELRSMPSGSQVANFSVATTRIWKDKAGAKQEDTQFHNIVVFGVQAGFVHQYLKKGSAVMIEGRMQTRSWDDQSGQKKYRTEIIADRVQFGPRREGGAPGASSSAPGEAGESKQPTQPAGPELDTIQYPEEDINPDDIPF